MTAKAEAVPNALPTADEAERKGHPKGLYSLFFTEMWERFNYYGMRAMLVLFLVQYHGWQPSEAAGVYKWYTSLVYLTPLLGGYLADRFIGLRLSITIGGVLMAAGQFLLSMQELPFFYGGLALLILGNGFFKPNISTVVGKMYKPGDSRRDGAFTIFYMGINIGAGIAPVMCGYAREHFGFRYGFILAGIGMLIALVVFLTSQRRIIRDVEAAGNDLKIHKKAEAQKAQSADERSAMKAAHGDDENLPRATGFAGLVGGAFPFVLMGLAVALPVAYWFLNHPALTNMIMPVAFGLVLIGMAIVLLTIKGAARDKSIVIFALFIFAVLFWMAFEQAGSGLTFWAAFHTDLHLFGFQYPAEWWQSMNAVLIVVFAPMFAAFWVFLAKRGKEPSTPAKMFAAMLFMGLSFGVMVYGASLETKTVTREKVVAIPDTVKLEGNAGRLTYDDKAGELVATGVLPRYLVNALLEPTVPKDFKEEVEKKLEERLRKASSDTPVSYTFETLPAGYKFPFDGESATKQGMSWDAKSGTLTSKTYLQPAQLADVYSAGAPPEWRDPLWNLEKTSDAARVSSIWLLLSYLFATLGELCLSPVGLSMVTKLAPLRFASLFMGVWLLSSSVAQYAGGSIGESWGKIAPTDYFMIFVVTSIVGAVLLLVLVAPLRRLMHDVR